MGSQIIFAPDRPHFTDLRAEEGIGFKKFLNVYLARRIAGHLRDKAPVSAVKQTMEDHFAAEKPVVQGQLDGHHARQVLTIHFVAGEDVLFKSVDQIS